MALRMENNELYIVESMAAGIRKLDWETYSRRLRGAGGDSLYIWSPLN